MQLRTEIHTGPFDAYGRPLLPARRSSPARPARATGTATTTALLAAMLTGASAGVWLALLGNELAARWVERALVALGALSPSVEVLTLGATLVLACASGILALLAGAAVEATLNARAARRRLRE